MVSANRNASAIEILIFGTERAHNFRVCYFFPVVHGDVVIVGEIEYVCDFDVLGGF